MPTSRIYKLTREDNTTFGGCKWVPGKWKKVKGYGNLCSSGWLHAYSDPLLAVLMNPLHARFSNPKLWVAEGRGKYRNDRGLKCGYSQMRILNQIDLPVIPAYKKVKLAIIFAILSDYNEADFIAWALHWLDGTDRTMQSAYAIVKSTENYNPKGANGFITQIRHDAATSAKYAAITACQFITRPMDIDDSVVSAISAAIKAKTTVMPVYVGDEIKAEAESPIDVCKVIHEICD